MLTNPIGLIITAISLLIGIGYLLYRNWDKIAKALASAWNWLKNNWQKLLQAFLWTNPILAPIMALNKLVQYVFGIDLFTAGKKIIESLWKGILSVADKPINAVRQILQKLRNMLPSSPAKEGPLKDIHKIKLIETIAQSITPAPLVKAMQTALTATKQTIQPFYTTVSPGVNIVVNLGGITISGKMTQEEIKQTATNLEKEIRAVLEKIALERFRRQY